MLKKKMDNGESKESKVNNLFNLLIKEEFDMLNNYVLITNSDAVIPKSPSDIRNESFSEKKKEIRKIISKKYKRLERKYIKIRNDIIKENMGLIVSVVKSYVIDRSIYEDILNESVIGICSAIDRFNPSLGFKFTTYSVSWIKRYIKNHINFFEKMPVKIPRNKFDELKLKERMNLIEYTKNGKFIDDDGVTYRNIDETFENKYIKVSHIDFDNDEMSIISYKLESMDNRGLLADMLNDSIDCKRVIESSGLSSMEKRIIMSRFGFDDEFGEEPTLSEIGVHFGVSRERIRQIEYQAISKMRRNLRLNLYANEEG